MGRLPSDFCMSVQVTGKALLTNKNKNKKKKKKKNDTVMLDTVFRDKYLIIEFNAPEKEIVQKIVDERRRSSSRRPLYEIINVLVAKEIFSFETFTIFAITVPLSVSCRTTLA